MECLYNAIAYVGDASEIIKVCLDRALTALEDGDSETAKMTLTLIAHVNEQAENIVRNVIDIACGHTITEEDIDKMADIQKSIDFLKEFTAQE